VSANNDLDDSDYRVKQRVIERINAYHEGEREAEPNNAILRCQLGRLMTENTRLREQLRIATETLSEIARCGCSACGAAPRDLAHARTLADDALTCMSVVE
jgi:mevalonate kinase